MAAHRAVESGYWSCIARGGSSQQVEGQWEIERDGISSISISSSRY